MLECEEIIADLPIYNGSLSVESKDMVLNLEKNANITT